MDEIKAASQSSLEIREMETFDKIKTYILLKLRWYENVIDQISKHTLA